MNFEQDWFMRQMELMADGAARKLFNKPNHEEHIELRQFAGDDLVYYRLCALLARLEFCAAENLLWEHLRPGEVYSLRLAEEFYRQLGEFGDDILKAHGFSLAEAREGLERARSYVGNAA